MHWSVLIEAYRSDEYSPIRDVKANTRQSYLWLLDQWLPLIGRSHIAKTDYLALKQIERQMREGGKSSDHVHRMFTMLRTVAAYGKMTGVDGARDVSDTLSEMRFKTSPPRTIAPTREQVMRIVEQADRQDMPGFALGLLLQWWLALRPVDVFGHWLVVDEGKRPLWRDGLTWDMVAPDYSSITKVISKTAGSMPTPIRFDLTHLPDVRMRLAESAAERQVGPVVRHPTSGQPYTLHARSKAFRRLCDAAGLRGIQMRDLRAGAVTEAKGLGIDVLALRDAAGHANVSTTSRYARDRDASVAKVIEMRAAG